MRAEIATADSTKDGMNMFSMAGTSS